MGPAVGSEFGGAFDEGAVAALKAQFGTGAKPVGCARLIFQFHQGLAAGRVIEVLFRIDPCLYSHGGILVKAYRDGMADAAGEIKGGAALGRAIGGGDRWCWGSRWQRGSVNASPSQDENPRKYKKS